MNPTVTTLDDLALEYPKATAEQIRLWREAGCPQDIPPQHIPDPNELVMDDGAPIDNVFTEKQQRLLAEALYASWAGPGEGRTFKVLVNVGLFYKWKQPPLVPDIMVSLDVDVSVDLTKRENRSYLSWIVGKMPEVVIEIVSDLQGGEHGHKMRDYARLAIPHYVIFDPDERLKGEVLEVFTLRANVYQPGTPKLLSAVGLGLTLWQGKYEGQEARWLRWCDEQGRLIPTGRERADEEHLRADEERQGREQAEARARRLAEQLRALGIDPAE